MNEPTAGAALPPTDDAADRRAAREASRCALTSAGVTPPVELAEWRSDAFGSPDLDYDLELPQLVLAVPELRVSANVRFAGGRRWLALDHQCAGIACDHVRMIATVLSIRPEAAEGLFRLERRWYDSQVGAFGLTLDTIEVYRDDLRRLGVDCRRTFADLREALYPIDPSAESLSLLSTDVLPEDLDDLLEFSGRWARFGGSLGRWRCYLLGVNSD